MPFAQARGDFVDKWLMGGGWRLVANLEHGHGGGRTGRGRVVPCWRDGRERQGQLLKVIGAGRPLRAVAAGALLARATTLKGALGGRRAARNSIGVVLVLVLELELEFGGTGASFAGRRRRGCAGAFGGSDEAVGSAVAMFGVGAGARVEGIGRGGCPLALAQDLAHVDTAAREDAREDASLEGLALDAGEPGQQRGRCDEVAAEPGAVLAALLDDVQLVANLKGQVGGRRGLEWIGAYCEGDPRERPPARHGASRVWLSAASIWRAHHGMGWTLRVAGVDEEEAAPGHRRSGKAGEGARARTSRSRGEQKHGAGRGAAREQGHRNANRAGAATGGGDTGSSAAEAMVVDSGVGGDSCPGRRNSKPAC